MKPITLTVRQIALDFLLTLLSGIVVGSLLRGCDSSRSEKPPETSHSKTTEKSVSFRPDSAEVQVSLPRITLNARGRAQRTDTLHTISLDTVGFFSQEDTAQIYPDTISVALDTATSEFNLLVKISERKRLETIYYQARDSLISVHDSLVTSIPSASPWWHDPALILGGITVGTVIGILIGLLASH